MIYRGIMKWFSRPKGFGFIQTLDGKGDAYLHLDVLLQANLREIKMETEVEFEASQSAKGLTVTRILKVIPAAERGQRAPVPGETVEGVVGTLIWFSAGKEKGVIAIDAFDDVAEVELVALREAGIFSPRVGEKLVCDVEWQPPVFCVRRVRRVN